jgi:RNA-directed DNA polymerase
VAVGDTDALARIPPGVDGADVEGPGNRERRQEVAHAHRQPSEARQPAKLPSKKGRQLFAPKTLELALQAVVRNAGAPGLDGQTTEAVAAHAKEELEIIGRQLREARYEPEAVKRVWIEKAGSKEKRPLGLPTVRDRIVQKALQIVLEPIFEKDFAAHSYGFRPARSARGAVERVEELLKDGNVHVVDADLKGYFDSIPQDQLMERVGRKIADGRVLALLEKFLKQGVMESGKEWQPTPSGTPQGAVMSPLLANIYLDELDHLMAGLGFEMVRYADDFVILCPNEGKAREALEHVREWTQRAGLVLHPEKTKLVDASARGGFDFLGWHFERGYRWPREKSEKRFKETIREKTRRTSGEDLPKIIAAVNRTVRGWGTYFRGGVRNVPIRLEKWIRQRLRSILRARAGRAGPARGLDHQRYPNSWLTDHGLISLSTITHDSPQPRRAG